MRIQGRRILLFLDNSSTHPHLAPSNIKLLFLPPNTTSKLQPMDAGIIQNVKLVYRKLLLRHITFLMDEAATASDVARQVSFCLNLYFTLKGLYYVYAMFIYVYV